ncbi:MAG: hypothetical protein ACOCUS_02660, partial [Polyangiales bacterium]
MAGWLRALASRVRRARQATSDGALAREEDPLRTPGCSPSSLRRCCERAPGSFACTWKRLFDGGVDGAAIGDLVGRPGATLEDSLRTLFPEIERRPFVDREVRYDGPLTFRFRDVPEYEVERPIDWADDRFGHRGARLWLQNLSWVDRVYKDGGTAAAAYVIVDWADRALFADPPYELTWDDHAVAARPARTWRFFDRYVQEEVLNVRVLHACARIFLTHVYALATDDCYTPWH